MKKLSYVITVLMFSIIMLSGKSEYFYYDTKNISNGYTLFGLSVKPAAGNITYLFPTNNLPDGFTVYKNVLNTNGNSEWKIFYFDGLFGEWNFNPSDTNAVIEFGEAVYLYNPSNITLQNVFIGNVVQNSVTTIKKGYNLISIKTLKKGGISTVHGLSANNGDQVYKKNGNSWSIHTFEDSGEPEWVPSEPIIEPFEGFFYYNPNNVTINWVQNDYLPNNYNSTERRTLVATQIPDPMMPWIASIYCVGTKLNTESMITFSYTPTLTNANWNIFSSYGPGFQPNDEIYTAFWAAQQFNKYGYIRISTW